MQKFEIGLIKTISINKSIVIEAESEFEAVGMALKQIDFSTETAEYEDYSINYINEIKNKKNKI